MCNILGTTKHGIVLQEMVCPLHQWYKMAALWDGPRLVLRDGLSKKLKQGMALPEAPLHELFFVLYSKYHDLGSTLKLWRMEGGSGDGKHFAS